MKQKKLLRECIKKTIALVLVFVMTFSPFFTSATIIHAQSLYDDAVLVASEEIPLEEYSNDQEVLYVDEDYSIYEEDTSKDEDAIFDYDSQPYDGNQETYYPSEVDFLQDDEDEKETSDIIQQPYNPDTSEHIPYDSPVNVSISTPSELNDAINDAPTDGTLFVIGIANDLDISDTTYGSIYYGAFNIPSGANIVIQSSKIDNTRAVLRQDSTSAPRFLRHFHVSEGAQLKLINLDIDGVNRTVNGGGLLNRGILRLDNVIVQNNKNDHQSNNQSGKAGGIWSNSDLFVNNSIIRNNASTLVEGDGGGIYVDGEKTNRTGNIYVEISNTQVYNNISPFGAGLFLTGYRDRNIVIATLENISVFDNETVVVPPLATRGFGGGLLTEFSEITIINSEFTRNISTYDGGGIFINRPAVVSIYDSILHGNISNSGYGGAISSRDSTVNITRSIIGIDPTRPTTTFANKASNGYGGGIELLSSTLNVDDSIVNGNISRGGSGVYLTTGLNTISDIFKATATINNSYVINNVATASDGGGIKVNDINSALFMNGSTVNKNTSPSFGGGIGIYAGSATIDSSVISENTAYRAGAIVVTTNETLTIDKSEVNKNTTTDIAGAIFASVSNVTINDSNFIENMAGSTGGNIYLHNSNATITGSNFLRNSSATAGGAIYAQGGDTSTLSNVKVSKSWFEGNFAKNYGGAFLTGPYSIATIEDSTFIRNKTERVGGAIANGSATITLDNVTLKYNQANIGGGLHQLSITTPTPITYIKNSTITNNTALSNGGGIDVTSGSAAITNTSISGNEALHGGGVNLVNGTLTVKGTSSFNNNIAANKGGGLYVGKGSVEIEGSTFYRNTADFGGGIYVFEAVRTVFVTVNDTLFDGNQALSTAFASNLRGEGGGIFLENYNNLKTGHDVIFRNNRAPRAATPPTDYCDTTAVFPNIQFVRSINCSLTRSSITRNHIINNYDINYVSNPQQGIIVVSYDSNGGIGTIDPEVYAYDNVAIEVTLNSGSNFTRVGHRLVGWHSNQTLANNGDIEFALNEKITIEEDLLLYAVWEAIIYHIIFHSNDGLDLTENQDVLYDETLNLRLNTFTRPGYRFLGWALRGIGEVFYTDGQSYHHEFEGDLHLYAIWQLTHTVTFLEEDNTTIITQVIVDDGGSTTVTNPPVKNGYHFVRWQEVDSNYVISGDTINNVTRDLTFIPIYEVNSHVIIFNPNGGTGYMANQPINYLQTVTLSTNLFVREGYTFLGWATSPNGPVVYTNAQLYTLTVDTDVTLYAVWQSNLGELEVDPEDKPDPDIKPEPEDKPGNGDQPPVQQESIPPQNIVQTGGYYLIVFFLTSLSLIGFSILRRKFIIK